MRRCSIARLASQMHFQAISSGDKHRADAHNKCVLTFDPQPGDCIFLAIDIAVRQLLNNSAFSLTFVPSKSLQGRGGGVKMKREEGGAGGGHNITPAVTGELLLWSRTLNRHKLVSFTISKDSTGLRIAPLNVSYCLLDKYLTQGTLKYSCLLYYMMSRMANVVKLCGVVPTVVMSKMKNGFIRTLAKSLIVKATCGRVCITSTKQLGCATTCKLRC